MIYLKRSVDFRKDVTWIANELDEELRRNKKLYAGSDVNGAIEAAVAAGLERPQAVRQAREEIARCQNEVQDQIV